MNRVWVVTGTDTGVGKTVATAALAVQLEAHGRSPYILKPAQTGVTAEEPGDLDEVRRLIGPVPGHEGVRLKAALAPEAAARVEGTTVPPRAVHLAAIGEQAVDHEVIVEGAGGVLVPLGAGWTLIDLAVEAQDAGLEVRVLVVARAGLGTLNHTALTVRALAQAGLPVAGIVIGSWPEHPELADTENLGDLPRLTGVPVLGQIPAGAGALPADVFRTNAKAWLTLPR